MAATFVGHGVFWEVVDYTACVAGHETFLKAKILRY